MIRWNKTQRSLQRRALARRFAQTHVTSRRKHDSYNSFFEQRIHPPMKSLIHWKRYVWRRYSVIP